MVPGRLKLSKLTPCLNNEGVLVWMPKKNAEHQIYDLGSLTKERLENKIGNFTRKKYKDFEILINQEKFNPVHAVLSAICMTRFQLAIENR